MFFFLNNFSLLARLAGHSSAYLCSARWRRTSPVPRRPCQVPADFLGLCVANAPDPASDDYVIARLNELGLRHVRLDFTYNDRAAYTERFLDRLLAERFRVCLHLVQPREEAREMPRQSQAAEHWREFVGEMLDRYGSRAELIEIGATCNRRKWSGYAPASFLAAWQIAWEEARARKLSLAGPNVTDFEPFYNAGFLGELRRSGMLPSVHTDNLFVERATEPEAFDQKIAGRRLASALRFNLVRKAQLLQDIGDWAGVPSLVCAHVSWSLRRIARLLEDVEQKQADYLVRYACLAAASGALARVYWGPLIGQREGLIDDGTLEYPEIPHVTYYEQARGTLKDYRLRPAFHAFQTVNRLLAGATFQRRLPMGNGLEILEFGLNEPACNAEPSTAGRECRMKNAECSEGRGRTTDDGRQTTDNRTLQSKFENRKSKILHAVWTADGRGAWAEAYYPPELLAQAEIYARDGQRLVHVPRMFSESPMFILWPATIHPPAFAPRATVGKSAFAVPAPSTGTCQGVAPGQSLVRHPISVLRFAPRPEWEFDIIRPEDNSLGLSGVYLAKAGSERVDLQALIELCQSNAPACNAEPSTAGRECRMKNAECSEGGGRMADGSNLQSKFEIRNSKILRNSRNTVWSVNAPWNAQRRIVIKAFKPRGAFRRLLDGGKPNKALRSWNGAQELLRRGLATPMPLAFLTPGKTSSKAKSYYICEEFRGARSAREVFNAFSAGAAEFQGYSTGAWYEALASFLQKLHTRGIFFRDLSAGNLLSRKGPVGDLEFALIDTARSRFYSRSLNLSLRLCDLMRICHPLNWAGRRMFLERYLAHSGRRFRWWLKIPFLYYDAKHWLKNRWKQGPRK